MMHGVPTDREPSPARSVFQCALVLDLQASP